MENRRGKNRTMIRNYFTEEIAHIILQAISPQLTPIKIQSVVYVFYTKIVYMYIPNVPTFFVCNSIKVVYYTAFRFPILIRK